MAQNYGVTKITPPPTFTCDWKKYYNEKNLDQRRITPENQEFTAMDPNIYQIKSTSTTKRMLKNLHVIETLKTPEMDVCHKKLIFFGKS